MCTVFLGHLKTRRNGGPRQFAKEVNLASSAQYSGITSPVNIVSSILEFFFLRS